MLSHFPIHKRTWRVRRPDGSACYFLAYGECDARAVAHQLGEHEGVIEPVPKPPGAIRRLINRLINRLRRR